MGETIRKTAAREDILADLKKSYDNAQAKGGIAATLADQKLLPILQIADGTQAQKTAAQAIADPLIAALSMADINADKAIGKTSDDVWNDIGRPAADAGFDLLFPGGNAFYVDGAVEDQPDKMDLLVELLKLNVHPKLSAAVAQACITTITAESTTLRSAVDAARPARAKLALFDRVLTAVARSAAIEISNFKRLLKANGFSEAEIHTIIPDRTPAAPKAPPGPPAPPNNNPT